MAKPLEPWIVLLRAILKDDGVRINCTLGTTAMIHGYVNLKNVAAIYNKVMLRRLRNKVGRK